MSSAWTVDKKRKSKQGIDQMQIRFSPAILSEINLIFETIQLASLI